MKETKWTAQIMLQSNRLTRVEFFSPSNLREDAEATVKAFCLLYTSPSPRDNRVSRMPSSA